MANESGINPPSPIKAFLERKDDHHAAHPLLHPSQALALPRPQLRADEVDYRDVELFELSGEAKVDVGEVNEDGSIRTALFDGGDEPAVLAIDEWGMANDLGDAHVGDVFGADDAVLSGVGHLFATEAEELRLRMAAAELGDDLRAVVVSTGFAC